MGLLKRFLDILSGNYNLEISSLLPHYYDSDVVIVHAMFQAFVDFYEAYLDGKENNLLKEDEQYSNPKYIKAMEEAAELYKWWIDVRPTRTDPIYVDPPAIQNMKDKERKEGEPIIKFIYRDKEHEKEYKKALKDSYKWDKDCLKEDKKMMKKLVDIHNYLIN